MAMKDSDEALAQKRYYLLSASRLAGAVMIATGLGVIANGFMNLPIMAGYALVLAGAFGFMVIPPILARRWKSLNGK
jgi:hypothetical protein